MEGKRNGRVGEGWKGDGEEWEWKVGAWVREDIGCKEERVIREYYMLW